MKLDEFIGSFYHEINAVQTAKHEVRPMMKKVTLFMALVGLAAFAQAATPTNTPTVTPNATQTAAQTQIQQTQTAIAATATYVATAFPTLTPTLTPTGTLTPSATFTPSPKQLKGDYRIRIYFIPSDFTNIDGSPLAGTALPGGVNMWLSNTAQGQTDAVMSTGSAETRLQMTVPWDFRGDGRLFLYMNALTIGDSVTLTANVACQNFNDTTQTVGTFSYTPPTGGAFSINGSATQVVAGYGGQITAPLWDTPLNVVSRVMMPLNTQAYAYWNNMPTLFPAIKRGTILTFDIKRTTGGSGNINIYGAEYQYDYYEQQRP